MSKTFDFDDLSSLSLTHDVCTRIDNSYLTKRISRLNPCLIVESRPKTQSSKYRGKIPNSIDKKIIPELRAAVEILKTRLNSTSELKLVSRPCTRYKLDNREVISPGKYHKVSASNGGHEFSKSPRLQDAIYHQISSE